MAEGVAARVGSGHSTDRRPVIDVRLAADHVARTLRSDVRVGLTAAPKWLPPKWFYDARGSELFEQITRLPEYYPTRAEREILTAHASDIADVTQAATLIELGSGSSEKTRLLLDALSETGMLRRFVPFDVSEQALRKTADTAAVDYPHLGVHAVVGDFTDRLSVPRSQGPRMVALLGSTIGNLLPDERARFLESVRASLEPGDWLLLGTDLVKDPDVLLRAYDDSAGVTAEFNRNVLRVLNRELGADFALDAFAHRAVWDPANEWVEMRLRAERAVQAWVGGAELSVLFKPGEELRTEVSAKFRHEGVDAELHAAKFTPYRWWTDSGERFAVSLARVV
ncbi:MAG: L-histidine N(alpha)-methyltransferase [Propionibacteriales bacterium]|nr:L-histidine N(alpha)-methyltransferase [Propionibacteriales bacterium]